MTSETSQSRELLAPYCTGVGLDVGFGGDPIVPWAITFDLPNPYTHVGMSRQHLRGDCRDLSMFCNGSLDFIYSSHLIEDFRWIDLRPLLKEWRRVLRFGGLLILLCPDEVKFKSHCATTGQGYNEAHKNPDFSLATFKKNCVANCWGTVFENDSIGPYSWCLVLRKNI